MNDLFFEDSSIWIFLLVTVVLGGAAAWTSGKSIAQTWRPAWLIVPYMLILALGIRFIHFALFEGTLLSAHYYAVDAVVLLVAAALGYRYKRALQMTTQYRWLYEKTGPFSWKARSGAPG
jgi:hypothetical protein